MSVLVTAPSVTNVTAQEAGIFDIVSTLISTDKAVTGVYGFVQKAALFLGGMSLQSYRKNDTWNPFAK